MIIYLKITKHTQLKKLITTQLLVILFSFSSFSQKIFFKSTQAFSEEQLNNFYSSIAIEGDLLLFNASDYKLYAYNKKDTSLLWIHDANYKSNIAPFVAGGVVWTNIHEDNSSATVLADAKTGRVQKKLPFGPLATRPVIKDGVLFGTAIYDAGRIIAYNIAKDTVTWSRFLAHGYSRQPYYFNDRILANAEADNWVELDYKGVLLDTICGKKPDIYITDIPCVRNFTALTHDRKEIKGKLAAEVLDNDYMTTPNVLTSAKYTFCLAKGRLTILGDKLKRKASVQLSSLSANIADDSYGDGLVALLKADSEKLWLICNDQFIIYNYKSKKPEQVIDLASWQPHQVLPDDDKLWLISKKDGLLYGLMY